MANCPHKHQRGRRVSRGVPRSLVAQWGLHGSEAPTCFGWCFHSGRQMASAQNLLALPTPRGPKPQSGTPRVGLEGGEGGPMRARAGALLFLARLGGTLGAAL